MANLAPLNFNPESVEDMGQGFSLVPPGIYTVCIVESDVQDNKASTGKILTLKCQIVDGPHSGKEIMDRLNIMHQNDITQKIGLSDLKHICDAIGFSGQLIDSSQLHGKPYSVAVEIEEFVSNKDGKKLQSNKIKKRMPRQAPVVAPAQQANAHAHAAGLPW